MVSNFLLAEQKKIKAIVPKMEPYWQREVRELPDDLKKELLDIKAIPPLTTSGLEGVKSVLESLTIADINIKEMDKKDKIVAEMPVLKAPTPPKTAPTPTLPSISQKPAPIPAPPQTNLLPTETTNLPIKTNINLPAPSTKPTQAIQNLKPKPTTPTNKIDFGKYHK